jgi:hypothetical protein
MQSDRSHVAIINQGYDSYRSKFSTGPLRRVVA